MHFWIDKRSSYGIGHSRTAGLYNQPRRMRSKSFAVPRPIPSTSHFKSHNNHRARHTEPNLSQHQSTSEQVSVPNVLHGAQDHVQVIHPVFPRDELPIEVTSSARSSASSINYWLPIQIIGAICMILAISLVLLKLYYDHKMTGWQFWYFVSVTILLIISTTAFSVLRMLKLRSRRTQIRIRVSVPSMDNNQPTALQSCEVSEPPPPYHEVVKIINSNDPVAINLSEKQIGFNDHSTPPPKYEKLMMA